MTSSIFGHKQKLLEAKPVVQSTLWEDNVNKNMSLVFPKDIWWESLQ